MSGALDDLAALRRQDAAGMLAAVAGMADQLRDGWDRSRRLALSARHRDVGSVAVLGMGGSAVAGDICRSVFADRLRVPLISVRDYELPASVGPETLVVASSYSGGTEETIAALTTALERRCPVAIITTGGPLLEVARRAELPFLTFPGEGQPRAAIGYGIVLLAGLLEQTGLLDGAERLESEVQTAAAAAAVTAQRCGPAIPTEENPAKELAWLLVDRVPVVEASGFLAPVARRWKTQFNENSKSMAVAEELPEATHNAVVGYAQPEAIHERLFYVFLASPSEHPRNRLRAALSAELLAESRIAHQVVPVAGEGRLAQACSSVCLGDFVSVYLAFLYGLDPTPVDVISRIKERLAEADDPDD